jgi:glycosyltransferase involved in cell wall biosynthesis
MLLDNPLRSDQRVEKEARSLAERGLKVVIIASDEDTELPAMEERGNVSILRMLSPMFKHPLRRGYRSWMEEQAKLLAEWNVRVLHCHDFQLLPLACAIKTKNPGLFLMYDSHEYLAGWPYYKEIPSWWNRFKGLLVWRKFLSGERRAARYLNAMCCPSKDIADHQKKRLALPFAPLVIRNIPNDPKPTTEETGLREALGISNDVFLLVHAGNIHQRDRDLDRLVDCVLKAENTALLFLGNRPRFESVKRHYSTRKDCSGKVFFGSYVPDRLIHDLSQCDAGIAITETAYLAHRIGSSNRSMEYSKAGIPILASDQESHQTLAEQFGHVVCFEPNDTTSIEEALIALRGSYDTLKTSAILAKDALDWNREIRPMEALYERLCKETSY